MRLELNARTALAQQRLARKTLAEREEAQLARARAEAEAERASTRAALEAAKAEAAAQREEAERRAARARALPAARRARARRRLRLLATVLTVLGLAASGTGVWMVMTAGAQTLLWAGGVATVIGFLLLQRMARVAARAATRSVAEPATVPQTVQDVELPVAAPRATWHPRQLPKPLVSSTGSRAAAVLDGAAAREALRAAALEEAKREKAEEAAPPSIAVAREERAASASPFASMGYVDDAEIEDHVRRLLDQRRAAG
ncbi:putative membrane protein YqiK [Microbacterium sp. SORGH_AS 888]|nr:putative membrane protein YqiK [Microbacterium sp. SORGH_AS_0888]